MNVQLLKILPTEVTTIFNIVVLIGADEYKFTMTIELAPLGTQVMQVINGDDEFEKLFIFSPNITSKIAQLVSKFYCQEVVELPAFVGDFERVDFEAFVHKHKQELTQANQQLTKIGV
jgi:hypothetical protein